MEFRTHTLSEELGPRIDWPLTVRNSEITRAVAIDQDGYDGTSCFTDFELVNRGAYDLTITLRPLDTTPRLRSRDDMLEDAFERFTRLAGELRYSTMPRLLAGIEGQLHRLTSEPIPPTDQLPSDIWRYLPTEDHFDFRARASRTFEKAFFRPDISILNVVDRLLSHDNVLTYSNVLLTVEYDPR